MATSKDEINQLKSLGFKTRSKKRYSFLTSYNQFFSINNLDDGFQIEIDGRRVYSERLSLPDVLKIFNLLYPNEARK